MKYLLTFTYLLFTGCLEQDLKSSGSDTPSAIKDVWVHENPTGTCATYFGDSSNGCVKFAQVVRFNDGTGYFTLTLGPPTATWTWSEYVPTTIGTFTKTYELGSNVSYRLLGDLSGSIPVLLINYDHNLNYDDTSPVHIPLTRFQ